MPDMNSVPTNELPSARSLLRSTIIAAAVAIFLLVTVVLPAEYGVDPTGVGRLLGLTEMGKIKVALAKEAAMDDSVDAAAAQTAARSPTASPAGGVRVEETQAATRDASASPAADIPADAPVSSTLTPPATANTHVTDIELAPNQGKEIKLVMRKDARVTYSWSTNRGVVNYDTHADAPGIRYHGYGKGTGKQSDEGVLVAAFDGAHGWFWRNRGSEAVTVTLRTNGDYQELKRM